MIFIKKLELEIACGDLAMLVFANRVRLFQIGKYCALNLAVQRIDAMKLTGFWFSATIQVAFSSWLSVQMCRMEFSICSRVPISTTSGGVCYFAQQ